MFKRAMKEAWGFIALGVVLDLIFAPLSFLLHHHSGIRIWELVVDWWQTGHSFATLGIMVVTALIAWSLLVAIIYFFLWLNHWLRKRDRVK
ncbi:hypothetical protein ACFQ44_11460 [Levilactobacillus lanxiensis]|uniref:DUF1361 domain-containing protein n=1 Tax=Levilactobacillus lanxiensis TaxID=2799568 RepID=A0ABW4D668_9LACO|nr:hypothetical protein [Levilactobacillus lanxiensis]